MAALALDERTPASWWAGPTAAHGHRIDKLAAAFVEHHYDRQRSGQPERRRAVVATIANDLLPFFAQHRVTVVERITHELAGKLAAHLAGLDVSDTQTHPPAALQARGTQRPYRRLKTPGRTRPELGR